MTSKDPNQGIGYKGDRIRLTVSKGPDVVPVPDMTGHSRNFARKTLEALGFNVRTFGPGNFTVRLQSPSGGSDARRGSTITITGF